MYPLSIPSRCYPRKPGLTIKSSGEARYMTMPVHSVIIRLLKSMDYFCHRSRTLLRTSIRDLAGMPSITRMRLDTVFLLSLNEKKRLEKTKRDQKRRCWHSQRCIRDLAKGRVIIALPVDGRGIRLEITTRRFVRHEEVAAKVCMILGDPCSP